MVMRVLCLRRVSCTLQFRRQFASLKAIHASKKHCSGGCQPKGYCFTSLMANPQQGMACHSQERSSTCQPAGSSRRPLDLDPPSRRGVRQASATTNGAATVPGKNGQEESVYHLPPQEIVDIVDAPPEPVLSFSPDRTKVLQMFRPPPNPPISELARPELKLAGLRIDTALWSRSRMSYYTGLALVALGEETMLPAPPQAQLPISGLPQGTVINFVSWARDGRHLAFTLRTAGGAGAPEEQPLELWVADTETGAARRLLQSPEFGLNSIFDEYVWVDADTIIALVVPEGVGPPPPQPAAPTGPRVQDNSDGRTAQARTYQDLLKNGHDEDLLDYWGTSRLVSVTVSTGETRVIGSPALYTSASPSPDGQYLLVSTLERPYSFNVPCGRFPRRVQLWDRSGRVLREICYLPLAEDIPIAFNSCRKGPRGLEWRDDKPSELCWMECQDEGDPAIEVSPRDIVYTLPAAEAAAGAAPAELARTDLRCGGLAWGDGGLALLVESWWKTRRSRTHILAPDRPRAGMQLLWERNTEDAYNDPGWPISRRTPQSTYVLAQLAGPGRRLLLQGQGASPEGNRPFLDILDLDTRETERLWQSSPPYLEQLGSLLSDLAPGPIRLEELRMLLTRESVLEPPQYYIKSWGTGADGAAVPQERLLSHFPHPYPSIKDLQKEIVRYKRADGVDLTATLYLPPGYDRHRDGPLPCLIWAYPREFKSKDAAGQMRKSPHQFSGIGATSPLLWLARRYAILDGPTMPIIAEGDEEPNDTYVEQLTASARAAVQEVVGRGVVDEKRIAVGGHSYGAFMTANLLAHAGELFACGIARSGAYNRTLTPFGFQSEERTLWQAPQVYADMSPFQQAHRIKKPLLLIHGEDDNNTGTFPMQSERFYAALKGHGAPCRLVLLPHESHGYRARESILHTLYEMDQWMERYCSVAAGQQAKENGAEAAKQLEEAVAKL